MIRKCYLPSSLIFVQPHEVMPMQNKVLLKIMMASSCHHNCICQFLSVCNCGSRHVGPHIWWYLTSQAPASTSARAITAGGMVCITISRWQVKCHPLGHCVYHDQHNCSTFPTLPICNYWSHLWYLVVWFLSTTSLIYWRCPCMNSISNCQRYPYWYQFWRIFPNQ